MKARTAEWVVKAEGDFATATREFHARKNPNFDAVCFHAQQCVEKYLKARLVEADLLIPRTHDLVLLLDLVLPLEPLWEVWRDDLADLSAFAVVLRYPGDAADKPMAVDAYAKLRRFRAAARIILNITD
jgi:HEPN domain-containing protein